jgi:outer membrane beta-barrel protein
MKRVFLLAVTGVLVAAALASAANREREFSLSPIIGGYTYDTNQTRKSDVNLLYGVRAGYNFTKNIGIEGLFDYVNSETENPVAGKTNMARYGGQLLYHFLPDNTFVPYLAAGYSGLKFYGSIDRSFQGAFDYGAGLKYFVNDKFAIRFDFRHLLYSMDGRTNNNVEYTVGAYIPLYSVKPAVKPVEPPPAPPESPKTETESTTQQPFTSLMAETKETPGKILVHGLNVFTLTEPSRLVIDIPNGVSGFKLKNIRIDKLGIATVRFENHPDYLRIFLDATQGRILPYRIEESDKSLKIIITTP